MGNQAVEGLITVATAIVGVAIVATLVSKNANTSGVLTAAGGAFGSAVTAATAPVTGSAGNLFQTAGWTGGAPTMLESA